ncbi:gas vesicle structural protein GvpA [Streptomyces chengbuensis]|uniref:gas vesicle structural protein GvpA n=1 Tax=Streptomyces TaxID=1883 RepID=UPI0025B5166E|nr:gas vesicle structural protein GvpA [Streptomyces sp. HUAS CB01]WJY54145.1 gas vesicle structural protein GvpA [Streptomyces sp. HUAS CB01]
MTVVPQGGGGVARGGGSSSLYDVLELILDRGLVIDVFVRVSLVGIEILRIDARIVVASVDTYLRFAEACNRLDLEGGKQPSQLTDLVGDTVEKGARGKSKGALSGAVEAVTDTMKGGGDEDEEEEEEQEEREPAARRRRTTSRRPRRSREREEE